MARCNSCNKFVSYDSEQEPDVRVDVDETGYVDGSVTISNACAECGQEMTSCEFSVEADFSEDTKEHKGAGHDLSVELDASRTDRFENKTRTGKKIRNSRYMKHMYGAEGEITVSCTCGSEWRKPWSDEVQSSGMDEVQ